MLFPEVEETKLLSKNLIKASQFVLKEKEPVVVDSNELVARKIEEFYPAFTSGNSGGFQSGLNAPQIDPSLYEMEMEGTEVQQFGAENELMEAVYADPSPEELIAEAQAEIEEMRKEAEKNISFLKKRAMEEGRQAGYEEGRRQAMQEFEENKKELDKKAKVLEEEFQNRVDQLEPMFIETLTGIYEQIFNIDLAEYKPILINAIANTIRQIEGSRDFLVHISRTDYQKIMKQKEELLSQLPSQGVSVELIEDASLHENECMIETSNGIYECGIGTQLEELTRKLKLLSFEK